MLAAPYRLLGLRDTQTTLLGAWNMHLANKALWWTHAVSMHYIKLLAQALIAKLHVGFIGSAVPFHRLEQSHRIPANPVFIVPLGKRIYSVQDTRCKAHHILRQAISNVTQAIPLIKAAEWVTKEFLVTARFILILASCLPNLVRISDPYM
jgi:hypothetical protein